MNWVSFLISNVHNHSEAHDQRDYQFLRLFLPLNWLFIVRVRICSPFHTDLEKLHKYKYAINMLVWGGGRVK